MPHKKYQQVDETDALLSHHDQVQYCVIRAEEDVQPDEEAMRREREALEEITARATDDMIDASHPVVGEYSYHSENNADESSTSAAETADEEAWLRSLEADGLGQKMQVKGLNSGTLIMDIDQLRQDESARP
ncbi:hypothetical protein LTR78_001828 [Recurvomyces mirabilis]|uniref:Uncharacterized protein n=1 Tax=Recurvomyces mirabilis TaxID=574656 RepID=A0AAE1C551_9PEZI|nr:hypothetical protein LTR78_001828 [Recurvomyces mirabilis]KAK5156732.1 hypothetical protein LTS14_004944 [Recurvomyces mirabilis]